MLSSSSKLNLIKRRRISREKFGFLIKCFAVDLTAIQTAKILLLNRNTINRYFTYFRHQIIAAAIRERKQQKIKV